MKPIVYRAKIRLSSMHGAKIKRGEDGRVTIEIPVNDGGLYIDCKGDVVAYLLAMPISESKDRDATHALIQHFSIAFSETNAGTMRRRRVVGALFPASASIGERLSQEGNQRPDIPLV